MYRIFVLVMVLACFRLVASPAHVSIYPSPHQASEQAARKIADLILLKGDEKTVLGLATGNTMIPVYAALKKIINEESIDLSNVVTFNLDEYLDIPSSHPQSFRSFMFAHLFDEILSSQQNPLGIKEENIHIPSHETWKRYEDLLAELGPIDLQLLGIGRNGHIGFAEPGTSFDSRTMIVDLLETTRQDNACFFDNDIDMVPKQAVTMGISTILEAKEILLLAFGESKAEAIDKSLKGPITTQVPSTALQSHQNTSFLIDEKAAQMLKNSQVARFTHARILLDHQIQEGELWVAGGKIIPPQQNSDIEIDVHGKILAPGLIDLQINGAFGCDFSTNPEMVDHVAKQLPQFGVTAFLPTVISSTPEQYKAVLSKLQPRIFKNGSAILGIHLEGPFFSFDHIGAHNHKFLLSGFDGNIEDVYGDMTGVKIVTLAPEIYGGIDLIKLLKKQGIFVSAGHSSATFDQMLEGIDAGVDLATHLFNAMDHFHHRNPSIVGAVLINPKLPYTLIVDDIHLSSETVLLCWNCNPDGLILISDATAALDLAEGHYKLGSLDTEVHDGKIYVLGTKTIAGSNISLNKAVQLLHAITHCSLAEALESASLKPAKLIQAYPSKGTLAIGADADLIILSDELEVEATYIAGELAWRIGD